MKKRTLWTPVLGLFFAAIAILCPQASFAEGDAAAAAVQIPHEIEMPLSGRLINVLGLLVMMLIAWALSSNRKHVHWRVVGWGVGLQAILGVLILRTSWGRAAFDGVTKGVNALLGFYMDGANLVFGDLMNVKLMGYSSLPFVLSVVPTVIFFSSLMAVLYHLKVMQKLIGGIAWLMRRTLKTSGAESLSAAGNIFVGQTEAPLLVRPYIGQMTESELMAVMVGGFATVAGGVMVAYVGMLQGVFADIAGHLMTASIMSAPASLLIAKLMVPEDGNPVTRDTAAKAEGTNYQNVVDAAAGGAAEGVKLALNMAAMLIAFVALVSLLNALIGVVGGLFGAEQLTFQKILGYVCAPLAWLMGVPWADAPTVGSLIGTKTVLNEFYAYADLASLIREGALSPRSVVIATYALCGFANFGSIAIQVGGMSGMAPERRGDLARLGIKAMVGGTLAAFMTANIAGILI